MIKEGFGVSQKKIAFSKIVLRKVYIATRLKSLESLKRLRPSQRNEKTAKYCKKIRNSKELK